MRHITFLPRPGPRSTSLQLSGFSEYPKEYLAIRSPAVCASAAAFESGRSTRSHGTKQGCELRMDAISTSSGSTVLAMYGCPSSRAPFLPTNPKGEAERPKYDSLRSPLGVPATERRVSKPAADDVMDVLGRRPPSSTIGGGAGKPPVDLREEVGVPAPPP